MLGLEHAQREWLFCAQRARRLHPNKEWDINIDIDGIMCTSQAPFQLDGEWSAGIPALAFWLSRAPFLPFLPPLGL
jgi:hypothetical protein